MNFNVDPALKQAVTSFDWAEPANAAPFAIHNDDLNAVVTDISKKILGASAIRGTLEKMNGPISLVDTCFLVVQDQDKKLRRPVTLYKIQQAAAEEKNYLNRSFEKLSLDFVQVAPDDLKAITLLFGIKYISELAAQRIIAFTPKTSEIERIETSLTQLKTLRAKFNIDSVPDAQKEFLRKIDAQIEEQTAILEGLKKSSLSAVA